jgi:hypothetical protein
LRLITTKLIFLTVRKIPMRSLRLALLLSTTLFGATMHTRDVIRMVRNGASIVQIVEKINASQSGFVLYREDVNALKEDGVPEVVIQAMFARNANRQYQLSGPSSAQAVAKLPMEMATLPATPPTAHSDNSVPKVSYSENSSSDGWSLRPGRPEVIGRFGLNAGPSRSDLGFRTTSWTAGGEVAVGITPWMAGIGNYGFNNVGKISEAGCLGGACFVGSASVKFHEFTGGLRFSVPTRFSPYAVGVAGAVRLTEKDALNDVAVGHTSLTKPAFGGGGGLNLGINRHLGTQVDFRILKVVDISWYLRATAGVYVRF